MKGSAGQKYDSAVMTNTLRLKGEEIVLYFFRAKDLFTVKKMTGESCARNKFKVGRMWNFFLPHFISVNELLTEHVGILCNEGKLF